eukprot:233687-Rhodomonas_salina.1
MEAQPFMEAVSAVYGGTAVYGGSADIDGGGCSCGWGWRTGGCRSSMGRGAGCWGRCERTTLR